LIVDRIERASLKRSAGQLKRAFAADLAFRRFAQVDLRKPFLERRGRERRRQ